APEPADPPGDPGQADGRCMMAQKWTRAEDDILESWHGLIPAHQIAKRLVKATGIERTENAVRVRAQALGLDYRTAQDGISVADAARELGIKRGPIDRLIRRGVIKTKGHGHC